MPTSVAPKRTKKQRSDVQKANKSVRAKMKRNQKTLDAVQSEVERARGHHDFLLGPFPRRRMIDPKTVMVDGKPITIDAALIAPLLEHSTYGKMLDKDPFQAARAMAVQALADLVRVLMSSGRPGRFSEAARAAEMAEEILTAGEVLGP